MPIADEVTGYIPEWESLRQSFKPTGPTMILFVGESPPDPIRGKFFYVGGPLTAVFQKAFACVFPQLSEQSHPGFLHYFQAMGCFLDDISHRSVVGMEETNRNAVLEAESHQFARRLGELRPVKIVGFVKRTRSYLENALQTADLNGERQYLSFPLSSAAARTAFMDELPRIIEAAHLQPPAINVDHILHYCSSRQRVCPNPMFWHAIFRMLPPDNTGEHPPNPLILAAWHDTPDWIKQERFHIHLHWAKDNGVLEPIIDYIMRMTEEQWHHFDRK